MPAATQAKRDDAERTPDQLLSIAERMFAEQGVENVALTQIVAASSQRNRSALHYHFGSREGVLTAVLSRRLVSINARRITALEALAGGAGVAAILRATIAALGEAVVEEPWGRDYLSILAQVTFHPQLLGERGVAEEHRSGIRLARARLAAALPGLSETLLRQRLGWIIDSVVFAMARATRDGPPTPERMAALIEQLTAFGAAGLSAPDPAA
jgi:AcrR family transcriptional regulator